jgi:hypothetical protein
LTAEFNYFCFGLLGGALVDGMDFVHAVRANKGLIPVRFTRLGYILGEVVRLAAGGALAAYFLCLTPN